MKSCSRRIQPPPLRATSPLRKHILRSKYRYPSAPHPPPLPKPKPSLWGIKYQLRIALRTTRTMLRSLPPRRPIRSRRREVSTRRRRRPRSILRQCPWTSDWVQSRSLRSSFRRRSRAWSCPRLCLHTSSNNMSRSCRRTRLCRGGQGRGRGLRRARRRTLVLMVVDLDLRLARPRCPLRLPHHLISPSIHPCKSSSSSSATSKATRCPARFRSPTVQPQKHRRGLR